ncbi:hypothetical protein ABIE26_004477 [Pedobacter africanus]|uniref:Uncharacterized protein n=1 Tax=Pedobacter africanus TaxID=151894 RepID=A0ACC6L3U6_9SPHI|nr:hypothetical protein [Pedobacter africanus]MDR6786053.1 hypothetical protein [Pedobacter africanus]
MKTIILFLITMVISTGALLASLSMKNPFIGPAIAFALVLLFMFHLTGKSRRQARQREKERLFYQYFASQQNRRSRFN